MLSIETGRTRRLSFAQYTEKRRELLKDLDTQEYSEADRYDPQNCCAKIAKSSWFFLGTMIVVVLNSLWLGVEANFNNSPTIWQAPAHFQIAEHLFGTAFIAELLVRFFAYQKKMECLQDGWFCFDLALVVLMVGETWVMLPVVLIDPKAIELSFGDISILRMLRLLRLTKLGRVARLLRLFPEVLTMLKGITLAMRSVFFTVLLLIVLVYLFGIIFKTQAEAFPELAPTFSSVGESMWVLLLHGTFLDAVADVVNVMREVSVSLTFMFLVFIFLSSFTLLNMLIGILCDVVTNVSRREKDQAAVNYLKNHLLEILEVHDKNDDRTIHKEEFELLMRNPDVNMILTNFGVDAEDLISLKDVLFEGKQLVGELPEVDEEEEGNADANTKQVISTDKRRLRFAEFLERVLRLRGGNGASVRDIVDLREYVRQRMDLLEQRLPPRQPSFQKASQFAGLRHAAAGGGEPTSAPQGAVVAQIMTTLSEMRQDMQDMHRQLQRLEEAQDVAQELGRDGPVAHARCS